MTEPSKTGEDSIRFHYIKSNAFRVVHADGVYGGISPSLKLQMAFYSERTPIPQAIVHALHDGELGEEIVTARVSRDGIVREVETNVLMDLDAAKDFALWLISAIEEIELVQAKIQAIPIAEPVENQGQM